MKKIMLIVVLTLLTVGVIGTAADPLAKNAIAAPHRYNHHRNITKEQIKGVIPTTRPFVCSVSGCAQMENHIHDDAIYYGHSNNDGHAYHDCGRSNCTQSGEHRHTASTNCSVSGCNQTGNHSHNRQTGGHHRQGGGRHH